MPPTILPEYVYSGNSVLDLVRRCIAVLEAKQPQTNRTRWHIAAHRCYMRFLQDENLVNSFTYDVDALSSTLSEAFPFLGFKIVMRLKSFTSTEVKFVKYLDEGKNPVERMGDYVAFRIIIEQDAMDPYDLMLYCYQIDAHLVSFFESLGYSFRPADPIAKPINPDNKILENIVIPMDNDIPEDDGNIKDYIRNFKPNGYQSLHRTFVNPVGLPFEVQIRTKRMDDFATEGYADHGRYKEAEYTNHLEFNPFSIKIPGYTVKWEIDETSGERKLVVEDLVGFERSRELFTFKKPAPNMFL